MPRPLIVLPYNPSYPAYFSQVAAHLAPLLPAAARIEHVGSTSVPGLLAKPVLDVDVVVEPEGVEAAVAALGRVGWGRLGDLGIEGREAIRAPLDWRERVRNTDTDTDAIPGSIHLNLYVCPSCSLGVRNHLAVRDTLRARPDLADKYGRRKAELAAVPGMDIGTYVAGKTGVLLEILEVGGMDPEEMEAIRKMNEA